ncbi:alanine racemase [Gordonia sp. HY285]|uniref:Alanine racemase n=1 Tax=Gordonia liuliyuniae TaxID=2911517 RepID=A0ABS9ITN8_9ACTN|nr:alanine racemase [Gordonia liuliyuniae]MCF8588907.1 alanine racemase [Gordonia liuliyuniae]MCF8609213.1 alanine racemase [Gordonia liuliyuniae]
MSAAPRAGGGVARLQIDLEAVAANTRLFADRTGGELMAVVKADGFGHGATAIARTALAHGASRLGVASLAEAFALRAGGVDAPLLSWLNPGDADWGAAQAARVDVAVPSPEHLCAVTRAAPGSRVHLHLDVDMARDGVRAEDWPDVCCCAARAEREGQIRVVGVMGHLGCAGESTHTQAGAAANDVARERFAWALRVAHDAGLRPVDRHLAATAATLTDRRTHHTMSRIGAGLVGIDPSKTTELRPALTLTAPVVTIRSVRVGTAVGYGHTWVAERPTRLALLPLGYADGLPRVASGRAEVLLAGRRCPIVGLISMDMTVVDIGDLAVFPGDLAMVFGPGDAGEPTVRDWAHWADTIEHEIVTRLGPRLNRTVTPPLSRLI